MTPIKPPAAVLARARELTPVGAAGLAQAKKRFGK